MIDETTRFDRLTRMLGQPASRRSAVGALVAGTALQILSGSAEDKDHRRKERQRKQQDRRQDRRQDRKKQPLGAAPKDCDVCAQGCHFTSVQIAVDSAKPGDTIRLCAEEYTSNRSVFIDKELTLVGAGLGQTTLQGGGFVRVLDIQPGKALTLRDLTVRGGVENPGNRGGGGGILVRNGGGLTLERCRVSENRAPTGGGIELHQASTLSLANSEVSKNTALTGGGGIAIGEGASATLKSGSQVNANKVKIFGGGIDVVAGTLILESNASVNRNEASQMGGGINASSHSTVTLQAGSHVSNNLATQGGGGLFSTNATVTIADSAIVTNNDPNNCGGTAITNCNG